MDSIKTKLRERRRLRRLRLLRIVFVLVCCAGALLVGWRYAHRADFAFGRIEVSGSALLSEDEILRLAGTQRPVNLFNVSADKVREALNHDVRFTEAKVYLAWPGVLRVSVRERQPALYVASDYASYLKLDYDGMVLDVTSGVPDGRAPVLTGEACGNVYIGDKIDNAAVLKALGFLSRISADAREEIVSLIVDEHRKIRLQMQSGYPILLGDAERADEKAGLFMTVFQETKNKNVKAEYIDLEFAKPYIKLEQ